MMTSSQKRGVKALLLGLRLIQNIRDETGLIANLRVYVGEQRKPIFSIYYEKDLPKQFVIKQTYKKEVNKELLLYLQNSKNFFIDFFWRHKLVIKKMTLKTKETKTYYTEDTGVWWGNEDCVGCKTIFKKYGVDCVDKDCDYNLAKQKLKKLHLKHHPDKGGDPTVFNKLHTCKRLVIDNRCYDTLRHSPE